MAAETIVSSMRPCKETKCIRWEIDKYNKNEEHETPWHETAGLNWKLKQASPTALGSFTLDTANFDNHNSTSRSITQSK